MTRLGFSEIPRAALKSHDEPVRIERVWRRLELDLAHAPRTRQKSLFWWAPAIAAMCFGAGVLVGMRWQAPPTELHALAEPRPALPLPGAAAAREAEPPVALPHDVPAHKRAPLRVSPAGEPSVDYVESYREPPAVVSEPVVTASGPAEWERLAESGDFGAAKEALNREGGFALALQRASASQLLILADIARASGGREEAAAALRRVLASYLSAPEAPLAAWTLGNLLEQAGDRAGADAAYATYRRLSPTGDFAEDAAARQVDAAVSQGNVELAARALEEYAANFPSGRRLAELRKRVALLSAPSASSTAASADADDDDESASEPSADAPAAPAPASEH